MQEDLFNLVKSKFTSFKKMNLSQEFQLIALGQVVQLHTLEQNRPYPNVYARRLVTQYASTVQLTLQTDSEISVKIYRPKPYADRKSTRGEKFINQNIKESAVRHKLLI